MASLPDRNRDARRIFLLLNQLRGKGQSLQQLMKKLDISRPTLRRDLALLRDVGFNIEEHIRAGRKILCCNTASVPLSPTVAAWLLLQTTLWDELVGGSIDDALQQWRVEALQSLGLANEQLSIRFLRRPGPKEGGLASGMVLDVILSAVLQDRCLRVNYRSFSGVEQRIYMEPWTLARIGERLYVLGPIHRETLLRAWRLDRIQDVSKMEIPFLRPINYNPEQFLEGRMGAFINRPEDVPIEEDFRVGGHWSNNLINSRLPIYLENLGPEGDMNRFHFRAMLDPSFIQWFLRMGAALEPMGALREAIGHQVDAMLTRLALSGSGPRRKLHLQGAIALLVKNLDWPSEVQMYQAQNDVFWEGPTDAIYFDRWRSSWGADILEPSCFPRESPHPA